MATPTEQTTAQLEQLRTEVEARLARVESLVDDLDAAIAGDDHDDDQGTKKSPKQAKLLYPTLESWVVDHFAYIYARTHGGAHRWCAKWWDHPEAISRFEALWRSWEDLRVQPLGMATWYHTHLDHQLPLVMGQQGPFANCSPDHHAPSRELMTEPAPDGWWTPPADDTDDELAGPGRRETNVDEQEV